MTFLLPPGIKGLTQLQIEEFIRAKKYHIYGKCFNHTYKRFSDHYHITRDYLGPAHESCNLQYLINPLTLS